jgi:hypothetical protein
MSPHSVTIQKNNIDIFITVGTLNLTGESYVLMHCWPVAPYSRLLWWLSVHCSITNVKTVTCTILLVLNVTYTVFVFVYFCVGCNYFVFWGLTRKELHLVYPWISLGLLWKWAFKSCSWFSINIYNISVSFCMYISWLLYNGQSWSKFTGSY